MRNGDIFRWTYKPYVTDANSIKAGTQYWCCSRIAIFYDGTLYDTYWSEDGSGEGRRWTKEEALKKLNCKFVANMDELRETRHPEYYAPENVVDLSHPNDPKRPVCVFKDAGRNREVMKGLILKKLGRAQYSAESATRDMDRLSEQFVEIDTADLNKTYII